MRLVCRELQKLFSNSTLIIYISALLLVNLLLLFMQTADDNIDYRKMGDELENLSPQHQLEYVIELNNQIDAIAKIEQAMYVATYDKEEGDRLLREDYRQEFERYKELYESGDYIRYTDNFNDEYYFLKQILSEVETVVGYETFLADLQERAKTLSGISIFAEEGGYSQNNIEATSKAFEGMSGTVIDYFPQMGIYTALNLYMTDVILIFIMILISFTAVRQERENGSLSLIRAMPAGRLHTAVAKICAVSVVILFAVVALYLMNLVYCGVVYGLGDLNRTIQSVPYLMRSTLKISVGQYFGLYLLTKWLAAVICGAWVLFAMLIAKNTIVGVLLSVVMPLAHLIIRSLIPATHALNVIKYANLASLLQTDEILGSYRNLHWLNNMPIQLNIVAAVSGVLFFGVFSALFLHCFVKMTLLGNKNISLPTIFKFKIRPTTVNRTEWYKLLVLNGGAILLVTAIGFQIYTAHTLENYITPEEMFYEQHAKAITGRYDKESDAYMSEQLEKFKPIRDAEKAMQNNEITLEQYNMAVYSDYALMLDYQAFRRLEENVIRVNNTFGAHVVYETGYEKLFGFDERDLSLKELIFATMVIILLLSGIMVNERTSGMNKVITAMPLGRSYTGKIKLRNAYISAGIIAVASMVPRYYQVAKDYGFPGVTSPANSLAEYNIIPFIIPIIVVMLLMLITRVFACMAIASIIIWVSSKAPSYILTVMISSLVLLLPVVLTYMGIDPLKYLSFYILFDFSNRIISVIGLFGLLLCGAVGWLAIWIVNRKL